MAYKWGVAVASSLITAMISPSTRQPLGMVYVAKKTLADTNSLIAWILFGPNILHERSHYN